MDRRQLGLEAGAALEQLAVVLDPVQADLAARGADWSSRVSAIGYPSATKFHDETKPWRRSISRTWRMLATPAGPSTSWVRIAAKRLPSGQFAITGIGVAAALCPARPAARHRRRSTSSGSIGQRGNSARAWRLA